MVYILRKFFIVMSIRNLPTILELDMPTSKKLSDSHKVDHANQIVVYTKIRT